MVTAPNFRRSLFPVLAATGVFLSSQLVSVPVWGDMAAGPITPPAPLLALDSPTYFAGEVITGRTACPGDCSFGGLFVLDDTGALVVGETQETWDGGVVFVPAAPLSAGTYVIYTDEFNPLEFEVIEGASEAPTFTATVEEVARAAGEPISCIEGGTLQSYPQTEIEAGLVFSFMGEGAQQYLYEFVLEGQSARLSATNSPVATFAEGTGEVCFEVFAIPFTGAAEFSLGSSCADTEESLVLGVRDEPFGDLEDVLSGCVVPPAEHVDQWCSLFEEAFIAHSCLGFYSDGCEEARYNCDGGDLPEWYEENDIDPADRDAIYTDADALAEAEAEERSASAEEPSGCSYRGGLRPVDGRGWPLLIGGLGAALLGLRRRRAV